MHSTKGAKIAHITIICRNLPMVTLFVKADLILNRTLSRNVFSQSLKIA